MKKEAEEKPEKKEKKKEEIVISEDVIKEIKKEIKREIKKEEKKEEVKPAKEEEKEGMIRRVKKFTRLFPQPGDSSKCITIASRIDPQTKLPAPDTAAASHDSLPAVDGVQKEYTKTPTLFGSRDHSISVCNNGVSITMHVEHTAEMAVVRIEREGWYASFTDLTDCETSVCVKFMDRTYMIPTLMKTTLDDFKACVIRVGEAKNNQS